MTIQIIFVVMNTKDFNPRAPHIHKPDLVKFLKCLDDTIHLPSSMNKQGLIKLVDQKLGRVFVAPATDCVLQQRSNSPALPVIPGTIDPNTNPQKPPSTQPVLRPPTPDSGDKSVKLEVVPDEKLDRLTHKEEVDPTSTIEPVCIVKPQNTKCKTAIPSSITIAPPPAGGRRILFTLYPSSLSPRDSNLSEVMSRMNIGKKWCVLDPVDPNFKPRLSRLNVGDKWCYIKHGQAGIVCTASIPTNAESAAAVGSLHYWDPKDDNKYKTSLSGSLPDRSFECNDKLDE
ncbi:hypothetical protein PGTUg99_025818 [Puccinia graminis f. sp. tritici]|uniref:Uncharacterized protein n=1 Tax=Puccinia graminis f. sp. tritici TaxID=56615 RepID=A0A5B0R6T1_PUCGR|nr:hypothetical protein PGTUg99_025818 [Puccinia graminis f. sp. tritici]